MKAMSFSIRQSLICATLLMFVTFGSLGAAGAEDEVQVSWRLEKRDFGPSEPIDLTLLFVNASDKPITICTFPQVGRLVITAVGPDADTLRLDQYAWIQVARLRGIRPSDFGTLQPNESYEEKGFLHSGYFGASGTYQLSATFTNRLDGLKFGIPDVWTGSVSADAMTIRIQK